MDVNKIPEKFYKGDQHVFARNVGELIDALSELPRNMAVESDFECAVEICVYNIHSDKPHVEIVEPDNDELERFEVGDDEIEILMNDGEDEE